MLTEDVTGVTIRFVLDDIWDFGFGAVQQITRLVGNYQSIHGFMSGKASILIVEDDTPLAMMMVNMLTQAQCDVLVAPSGEKGLELARENKFDLIVLAVDLPDTSGFEVCSELKQRHCSRHTPIVLISGQPCKKTGSTALIWVRWITSQNRLNHRILSGEFFHSSRPERIPACSG